jgi:predicted O-methyltransferase YrrM
MKKGEVSDKNSKFMQALDIKSLSNLIYNWKPRYILNYTPRYVFNRTKVLLYEFRYSDHPWLTQQTNQILSTLLRPQDVGLEWGSGRSTLWFAKHIKHLTSVEHDETWYKVVSSALNAANISNVNYSFCKLDKGEKTEKSSYVQVVNAFNKESIDFVLIDGVYRDVCANIVLDKYVRPGGIIVIDDANRYIPCDSIAPNSRPKNSAPASKEWVRFIDRVTDWRLIWTSNGIKDTAIWFKPSGEYDERV